MSITSSPATNETPGECRKRRNKHRTHQGEVLCGVSGTSRTDFISATLETPA